MKTHTHEDLSRKHEIKGSSDRSFGLVVGGILLVLALWPLLRAGGSVRTWILIPAVLLIGAGLLRPSVLGPINRQWMKLGLLLGRVVNPVVMSVMYYGLITPSGLLLRLFGKDLLRLRRDPSAGTYWIERRPPGPAPETMANQF